MRDFIDSIQKFQSENFALKVVELQGQDADDAQLIRGSGDGFTRVSHRRFRRLTRPLL